MIDDVAATISYTGFKGWVKKHEDINATASAFAGKYDGKFIMDWRAKNLEKAGMTYNFMQGADMSQYDEKVETLAFGEILNKDEDGDKLLDFEEFRINNPNNGNAWGYDKDKTAEYFSRVDADADGFISSGELAILYTALDRGINCSEPDGIINMNDIKNLDQIFGI